VTELAIVAASLATGVVTGLTAVRAYGTFYGILVGVPLWQATYWLGVAIGAS
jgi:hypothetical protein